jgi:PAS domain S-box-containing protein
MKVNKTGYSTPNRQKRTIRRARAQSSAAPAALPENEASLQAFFDALDDLVFVFEPEGRILFGNPAAQNQLGYTPAELAGMAALDLHPPEQRQEAAKLLAGLIAGKITICPIPLQARDGTRILVETKILHGQWRGKEVLLGISHDITRRKLAEEAMRESEEKYKALIETTGTGYVILDSEGKVLGANQEYVRLTGHGSLTEIIGKSVVEWTTAHDREWNVAEIRKCLQQGFVRNLEIDYVKQAGQVTPVEINATVVQSGQVVHILALCRDITERKLAEEAMQESEERFHQLFDDAPIGYHEIDREGRITRVNRTELERLGYTIEEMLGQPVWKFIGEEKLSQQTVLAKLAGTQPPGQGYERTFRRKNQTTFPALIEDRILHDAEGRIAGIRSVMQDITERKRAEEAREQSVSLLRAALESTADGILVVNNQGKIVIFNEPFTQLWRIPESILESRDDQQALAFVLDQLKEPERFLAKVQELYACPEADSFDVLEFKDGRLYERYSRSQRIEGRPVGRVWSFRDVTKRKQAEEAVRQSEERYRALVETAPDVVYIISDQGVFASLNPAFEAITGWTCTEWLGKPFAPLLHPEDASLAVEMFQRVLRGDKPPPYELRILSKSGKYLVGEFTSTPYIKDGKVAGKLGIVRDITERKRAEKALRQGEVRLEKINRCLLELGTNFDSNINRLTALCGELVGATCALYNRLQGDLLCSVGQWQTPPGFKSEDVPAGHICYDVIRNNQEDAVVITNLPATSYAESDPNVRAHGLQTYMGCAVKCEGKAVGSLCVVYGTDYRPTDDDRRILGIIASAIGNEDTRKQAEAELNRLMTAIEQTPESVVITDTKGRILYVNPVFEQVTGYSRAEAIGQNPRLLKSNRQESAFYRQLWAKISAGEVWRGRFINKKKDGTLFSEDAVIAPVRDEKGAVTNYIAIKRDISHELELEVQYRQTQKIDSIGRLAGGVAHDFNNILAVICGHTDLALAQLSPDAPLRSNLECIQESAERAANLTRQLLTFARRQVIEPRRINLNELIVNLNKMLHRLIGEDIKLATQTAPDLGQIKADPGQIEQVLLNLVVNARDAMPDGGTLTIHTDNVTFDEDYARRHLVTPGDYVMVSVSDTGAGMTDEVKQHIFEPFFTTKEQGKGTGLGLATCFGIIQQSNGYIHFESQVAKGAEFKIYLPRVRGMEDSISSHEVPVSLPQGTETILLAEDEPSLRQLMARVLRTQGYTVLEAADGHEALALAQANGAKIQLLLTDVIMPGLSGKTLAEWLGQVNPAVRVLFISGYINNNAVRDAMSKPGTFFLQKPFNPLDLAQKVREAIEAL